MPEIPDLNIFSKNVAKRLVGKKLHTISILIPRRLKLPEAAFKEALEGQELTAINRVGQAIIFCLRQIARIKPATDALWADALV